MRLAFACAIAFLPAFAHASELITEAEHKELQRELQQVTAQGAASYELTQQGKARLAELKRELARVEARYDRARDERNSLPSNRPRRGTDRNQRDDQSRRQQLERAMNQAERERASLEQTIQKMERDLGEAEQAIAKLLARQRELKEKLANAEVEKPPAPPPPTEDPSPAPQAPAPPPKAVEIVELTWDQVEGGHLIAGAHFLGRINADAEDEKSIAHPDGEFGSTSGAKSIWNRRGDFGSVIANQSPYNPFATEPPAVYSRDGELLGHLTVGKHRSPRLHPNRLREMIEKREPYIENSGEE